MKNVMGKIIFGDSRNMSLIENESIDLIVTSPPYWHIKDYDVQGQIGYGQTLHQYLKDLFKVWNECFRVLKPGRKLCINIGDQFTRSSIYGVYKVVPIHAEIIIQCETIGFDYMGSIIWKKKTTMNTSGGANVMGSYPYPPNGMLEIDYEHILIFRKPGKLKKFPKELKENSRLTKEEWKTYFNAHWNFPGTKQKEHEAMFPDELPRRLIKMYSFVGETVLDPFVGSGTTVKVSLELGRNGIGYEINDKFEDIIRKKVHPFKVEFIYNQESNSGEKLIDESQYVPKIKDMKPVTHTNVEQRTFLKVIEIIDEKTLRLENNQIVELLGIKIIKKDETLDYLKKFVFGKKVRVEFDERVSQTSKGYVYLKNGIFVNTYLLKSGFATVDQSIQFNKLKTFMKFQKMVG